MPGGRRLAIAALAAGIVLALAAPATAPAKLRVNLANSKLIIKETSPERDRLRLSWDPASKVSTFTDPAGLTLFLPGDDPNDGQYGGFDGCEKLSPTRIACGYLAFTFEESRRNLIKLGRGNDLLAADPKFFKADYYIANVGLSIDAGPGRDTVFATDRYDFIVGGGGADRLHGRNDIDELHGCQGNDLLDGGGNRGPFASRFPSFARFQSLFGGPGHDRYRGRKVERIERRMSCKGLAGA